MIKSRVLPFLAILLGMLLCFCAGRYVSYSERKPLNVPIVEDQAESGTSPTVFKLASPETKSQGLFHQIQKEVTFCGLLHGAYA